MSEGKTDELLEKIAERLPGEGDVVLASAFGSSASGKLRPDSDVDIAILTRDPMTVGRRRGLINVIADVAGRPVDLVELRTSGVVVTQAALSQGKRLISKGPYRVDEFALENTARRSRLSALPPTHSGRTAREMDPLIVAEKLEALRRCVSSPLASSTLPNFTVNA